MRYVFGFIVGVALTMGGAYLHDHMDPGSSSPLVNWTTAGELGQQTVDYVRTQFDRLTKWATSS